MNKNDECEQRMMPLVRNARDERDVSPDPRRTTIHHGGGSIILQVRDSNNKTTLWSQLCGYRQNLIMAEPAFQEAECPQQKYARERLEELRNILARLRFCAGDAGEALPAPHPAEPMIELDVESLDRKDIKDFESEVLRNMKWFESEVQRPASKRLPVSATPPREVLQIISKFSSVDDPPPPTEVGQQQLLHLVRTIVPDENHKMILGFKLSTIAGQDIGNLTSTEPNRRVGVIPWARAMETWSPENWAWLLAGVLKRTRWPVMNISLVYKLQKCPQDNFMEAVRQNFFDILYTDRYASSLLEDYKMTTFYENNINIDKLHDLALMFDSQMWEAACDVGLEVEDRTSQPALTYFVGDTGELVVDGKGKRWDSQIAYLTDRLKHAVVTDESLTAEEVDKLREFMLDVMRSQKYREPKKRMNTRQAYREYAEKKLGKRLCKIAKKYNRTIPGPAAARSAIRCDHCGAAEGTARDANGEIILQLLQCACNPHGRPYYCNRECQRADRDNHREFCTAEINSKSSKNEAKGSNSGEKESGASSTKKKSQKKKRNKRR